MKRILMIALLLINIGLVAFLGATQVAAHEDSNFFTRGEWALNANVRYKVDNNVPDGWRPFIRDGMSRWSDRADGRSPDLIYDGVATMSGAYSPRAGANAVFARNIDDDAADGTISSTTLGAFGVAMVYTGEVSGRVTGFTFILDTRPGNNTPGVANAGWYVCDGDVPSSAWDLQSIVTHETGHVVGFWEHFNPTGEYCPNNDTLQTMCGGKLVVRGTKWLRTLEGHDIHTLESAYNFVSCPPSCRLSSPGR